MVGASGREGLRDSERKRSKSLVASRRRRDVVARVPVRLAATTRVRSRARCRRTVARAACRGPHLRALRMGRRSAASWSAAPSSGSPVPVAHGLGGGATSLSGSAGNPTRRRPSPTLANAYEERGLDGCGGRRVDYAARGLLVAMKSFGRAHRDADPRANAARWRRAPSRWLAGDDAVAWRSPREASPRRCGARVRGFPPPSSFFSTWLA